MSEQLLSVNIYRDRMTPDVPIESAVAGVEIVREIAPWIQDERAKRVVRVGQPTKDFVVTDHISMSRLSADLNIVFTARSIVTKDELRWNGRPDPRRVAAHGEYIGMAFHYTRVNSTRVALVNPIGVIKPEYTVAHELGHLLGMWYEKPDLHCDEKDCLGSPTLSADGTSAERFCDCCSDGLHANTLRLWQAKRGKLGLAPNSIVF